jgi:uncharacterized protein (DUF2062 family)
MASFPKRRSTRRGWQRQCRYLYLKLLRVRGTPSQIARGLGVGVFSGMLPMFGLQTVIALALAFMVRGNKLIAVLGTWVSNPFTDIPIHLFNFQVGRWLLGVSNQPFVEIKSWQDLLNQGFQVVGIWLLGGTTMGLITGLLSYWLGFYLAAHLQNKRQRRWVR